MDIVDEPVTVKRYARARLYHTGRASHVNFIAMVEDEQDVLVCEATTGAHVSRIALGQTTRERARHD